MLLDHSTTHALPLYRACGVGHQGVLMIRRGDIAGGLELLSAGMDYGAENKTSLQFFSFCSELAHALGKAGQITAGLAAIDDAIDYSDRTEERWMMPEFMRVKGELLLLQSCSDEVATAEDQFRKAIDEAARQGALSWELRAATSLARLRLDQGRAADAIAVLQPVYDRFTEGFATADLKAAKALLDALG
jgi:predicted ATPase